MLGLIALQIPLAFFRFLHARFSSAALRNVLPVFISKSQNEFDFPFSPPHCFRFCLHFSSFSSFSSFSFTGPIGASFTCVCSENSVNSVDSSRRFSDVPNTCGGGEFDGCEGRTQPFLDDSLECVSESVMLQKTRLACAGGELNKVNFLRCTHTH